jgi:hypothetical protein
MSLLLLFQGGGAGPEAVNNLKLAFMEWCQVWEPGLPVSPGALGQDDQQQLLWGMPESLWGGGGVVEGRLLLIADITDITRIT